ncbi:HsmA family protein [Clostridium sp.]|uniref:HsmA family protein n=1 Tax=Clostridium sp. TaxID=1506 RepID=UPI001A449E48|nr:HsmA family protein [Clostridium sp.]MBK5240438.1 TIGR03987 family protein [Clostridium sp.]
MLVFSIILINLAFIIYTISILNEFKRRTLLTWHTIMFCVGFIFDMASTIIMYNLAGSKTTISLHGMLGYLALVIMLINVIGSVIILNKKSKNLLTQFYKFSLFAWIIWVISFILGMLNHM